MVLDQEGVAVGSRYRHLSIDERVTIEKVGGLGHSIRQIASHLGRSPSTISREIRRGHPINVPCRSLAIRPVFDHVLPGPRIDLLARGILQAWQQLA